MNSVKDTFRNRFGREPSYVVQAPGRVNLIGEHTDYNEGFVLPVAIDRRVLIAASQRQDRRVFLYSCSYDSQTEFSLDNIVRDEVTPWSNYPRGVTAFLERRGYRLGGLDALIASDLPIGAGLSSSAALELATAWAFLADGRSGRDGEIRPYSVPLSPGGMALVDLAQLCRQVENQFVGVSCGIMDQFISTLGMRQHALFLDCRSLAYQQVPLPDSVKIVVCNTGVKRELAHSRYNERRNECHQGVQFFDKRIGRIVALRDVSLSDFEKFSNEMDPLIRKRCHHVISENERVLESVRCLHTGALDQFGKLMNASHQSLRQDYEVSCRELDAMVEIAYQQPGVLGSRMTGAGFGGCTVNLVWNESVDLFVEKVKEAYPREAGMTAEVYVCNTADGAGVVSLTSL